MRQTPGPGTGRLALLGASLNIQLLPYHAAMTTIANPAPSSLEKLRARPVRIGAVSYLNTLPMIEGLGKLKDVSLTLTAPAQLIDLLLADEIDVGLISLIDAQRSPEPLAMIPAGIIGSGGATMTVRLFSTKPIDSLNCVHVDADSHTSVALMRIILNEQFGITPALVEFDIESHRIATSAGFTNPEANWPEALLAIGDKVVTKSPPAIHYPYQLDLGEAWNKLTGLPFVYAIWMCKAQRAESHLIGAAVEVLDRQRRRNALRMGWIAHARAQQRGWPVERAREYLDTLLRFELDERHAASIERFFDMCFERDIIEARRATLWV